jgi:hypothetical protein
MYPPAYLSVCLCLATLGGLGATTGPRPWSYKAFEGPRSKHLRAGSVAVIAYDPLSGNRGSFGLLVVDPLPKGTLIKFTQDDWEETSLNDDGSSGFSGNNGDESKVGRFKSNPETHMETHFTFEVQKLVTPGAIITWGSTEDHSGSTALSGEKIRWNSWKTSNTGVVGEFGEWHTEPFDIKLRSYAHGGTQFYGYTGHRQEPMFLFGLLVGTHSYPSSLTPGQSVVIFKKPTSSYRSAHQLVFCPERWHCTSDGCQCKQFKFIGKRWLLLSKIAKQDNWYAGTGHLLDDDTPVAQGQSSPVHGVVHHSSRHQGIQTKWLEKEYKIVCTDCVDEEWICKETQCRYCFLQYYQVWQYLLDRHVQAVVALSLASNNTTVYSLSFLHVMYVLLSIDMTASALRCLVV